LFDSCKYEVEFTDGYREKYQANVITENLYAQVDDEGWQFAILEEIVDHSKDNTVVPISEGFVRSANGTERPKVTTRGWKFLCRFKDGSIDWVKLKDLKESNIVEVAKYAVANRIAKEPAFKWWVSTY